jgi:hypothetical protein
LADNEVVVGVNRINEEALSTLPAKPAIQGHNGFTAFSAHGGEFAGSEVQGICAEPDLVDGYNLHPYRGRLAVSCKI